MSNPVSNLNLPKSGSPILKQHLNFTRSIFVLIRLQIVVRHLNGHVYCCATLYSPYNYIDCLSQSFPNFPVDNPVLIANQRLNHSLIPHYIIFISETISSPSYSHGFGVGFPVRYFLGAMVCGQVGAHSRDII